MANEHSFPAPDPQDRLNTNAFDTVVTTTLPEPRPGRRRGAFLVAAAALTGALLGSAAIVLTDDTPSGDTALTEQPSANVVDADADADDVAGSGRSEVGNAPFADADDRSVPGELPEVHDRGEASPRQAFITACFVLFHFVEDSGYPTEAHARGSLAGVVDGTSIVVHGPTINDGQATEVEVVGGEFELPLGVRTYGDHEVTQFDAVDPSGGVTPLLDMLPNRHPDGRFFIPVGPDEGPVFDEECYQIDQELPAPGDVQALQAFLDELVALHTADDAGGLSELLDHRIYEAFGEPACVEHLVRTTGSLVDLQVVSIDGQGPFTLDTSVGPITFDDVVTATVDMVTTAGGHRQQINLPVHHVHGWTWLTHCV